jgi:DnaJ-class molecular chaperone
MSEACPVCNGEGRVYRMTGSYEAMVAQAAGGSFGWTGPTHEWRPCRACAGRGVLSEPQMLIPHVCPFCNGLHYTPPFSATGTER